MDQGQAHDAQRHQSKRKGQMPIEGQSFNLGVGGRRGVAAIILALVASAGAIVVMTRTPVSATQEAIAPNANEPVVTICVLEVARESKTVYGEVAVAQSAGIKRGVKFIAEENYCKRFEVLDGVNFVRIDFELVHDISVTAGGVEKRVTVNGTAVFPIFVINDSFQEPLMIRTTR